MQQQQQQEYVCMFVSVHERRTQENTEKMCMCTYTRTMCQSAIVDGTRC